MSALIQNLDKMSVQEKLQAIEEIWSSMDDAQREAVEPPKWHKTALEETRARYLAGLEKPIPWEEARARLLELRKK